MTVAVVFEIGPSRGTTEHQVLLLSRTVPRWHLRQNISSPTPFQKSMTLDSPRMQDPVRSALCLRIEWPLNGLI